MHTSITPPLADDKLRFVTAQHRYHDFGWCALCQPVAILTYPDKYTSATVLDCIVANVDANPTTRLDGRVVD